jgi:hypothetical protein
MNWDRPHVNLKLFHEGYSQKCDGDNSALIGNKGREISFNVGMRFSQVIDLLASRTRPNKIHWNK